MIEKLKNKYENLNIFIDKPGFKYYLTPGPLRKEGNAEFCIGVKGNKDNKRLVINKKNSIKSRKKNMKEIYNNIKEGKTIYFVPSGNQYHFGIEIHENENNININFVARPNNAVGYGLNFLEINLDKNRRGITKYLEKILNYYGKVDNIQKFFKQFNGLKPRYKKNKPYVYIENPAKLTLKYLTNEINKQIAIYQKNNQELNYNPELY